MHATKRDGPLRTILAQSGRQKFAQSERIRKKAFGLGNTKLTGGDLARVGILIIRPSAFSKSQQGTEI